MNLQQLLEENRDAIQRLAAEHGAYNLRVFGSTARGDFRPDSDIDLLVEFEPGRSLIDRVALKQDLEDLLGCKVDIIRESGLREVVREHVLREAVAL